jgi:hypothetical protein
MKVEGAGPKQRYVFNDMNNQLVYSSRKSPFTIAQYPAPPPVETLLSVGVGSPTKNMKTLSCLSLRRLLSTFAALAIVGGLSLTTRAQQVGSGWTPGGETVQAQQTSAGCTITPIPGGDEFHSPSGHGRA